MKRFLSSFLLLGLLGVSAQAAQISVSDGAPNFIEGSSSTRPMAFTVRLNEPLKTDVSVRYATGDITATAPADYSAATGVVTFKAGQTSATINIPIRGDKGEEADERFRVRLSAPVGAVLGDSEGIGTVLDDDFAGKISIGPEISLLEGNDGFRTAKWTVSLSQKPLHPISVGYATKNGGAIAPEDFTATAGTILFSAGNLTKGINIPVVGDTKIEKDETFSVKLVAPGYAFERDGSTAIIRNDDKAPAPTPVPTATPSAAKGKIAFVSNRTNTTEIYVINADGTNETQLTRSNSNSDPNLSADGNQIVWASRRSGRSDIYLMNADGTSQRQITATDYDEEVEPAFSPDARKIVFSSDLDHDAQTSFDIYVMNKDGSGQIKLTDSPESERQPVFSPDGTRIAFVSQRLPKSDRDITYPHIMVMNADGSELRRLTDSETINETSPAFSPDGAKIVFRARNDFSQNTSAVTVKNLADNGQTALTNGSNGDDHPSYSPDGKHIAFTTGRTGVTPFYNQLRLEIFVMASDGTGVTRVTFSTGDWNNVHPSWGPGRVAAAPPDPGQGLSGKIAFVSYLDGKSNVSVMNANGTNLTKLTTTNRESHPRFSPDGERIVWSSERDGNPEIYVMNRDGSGQTRLTSNASIDDFPSFTPDGKRIIFASDVSEEGTEFHVHGLNIYLMNLDGSAKTQLTFGSPYSSMPSVSPDGTKITFVGTSPSNAGINVMNADGTNSKVLTDRGEFPSFSPDGTRILFSGIKLMSVDGSGQILLSTPANNSPQFSLHPCFSPDGTKIAFAGSYAGGENYIYVMNANGTDPTKVRLDTFGISPTWAPGSVGAPAISAQSRTAPPSNGPSAPSS